MKNRNNIEILQRMISKSDQIMDDIVDLTLHLSTLPKRYMNLDDNPLLSPYNAKSNTKEIQDYRNLLIEQFKESEAKSLQTK